MMTAEQVSLPLAADPWDGYQSRYVAYCRAHWARSPDAMLERDREVWPGGCMTGYILWINSKWRKWRSDNGNRWDAPMTEADHAAFDAWLEDLAGGQSPGTGVHGG